MKLKKKYAAVLEARNWRIAGYTDDGRVELGWCSPAGEDFNICVNVKDFPDAVFEYYGDFDPDEHIEMWIEAKRNGVSGVPSIRELVRDADAIDEELENLAIALHNAR